MNILKISCIASLLIVPVLWAKAQGSTSLDLKSAEKLSLDTEPDLRNILLNKEIGRIEKNSLWGEWLPSLSLSSSFVKTKDFSFQNKSSFLMWEETLINPFHWSKDLQLMTLDDQMVDLTAKALQKNVTFNVRNQYFNMVRWKEKIRIKEKNLSIARELKTMTEKKYAKGLTDIMSLERSKLAVLSEEMDFKEMKKNHDIDLAKFNNLLYGETRGDNSHELVFVSRIQMEKALKEFTLQESEFKMSSPLLDKAHLAIEKSSLEIEKFYSAWLPSLSLSGTYRLSKAPQELMPSPAQAYQINLTWPLFARGRDYWTYEKNKVESLQRGLDFKKTELNYQADFIEVEITLKRIKEKWTSRISLVTAWEKITNDMRQKYQQGLVNLRDLQSDMKTYLDLLSSLEDLKFEYIQNIVKALRLTNQEEKIYTYLN